MYTDITVTAHWINPKFELISACLKTCELPGSHTADVLAAKITEVSTQWKLNNRISGICFTSVVHVLGVGCCE